MEFKEEKSNVNEALQPGESPRELAAVAGPSQATAAPPSPPVSGFVSSVDEIQEGEVDVDVGEDPLGSSNRVTGFSWRKFMSFLGPGWLVAMAYLDPGNLEGDLQVGALRSGSAKGTDYSGFRLLWLLFWATVGGLLIQILSARLGTATGRDLATLCRLEYSRPVSFILWVMTELAIIGADLQAVIGSAIALKLLTAGVFPLWAGMLVTLVDTFTFLFIRALGIQRLEFFFAFLILIMAVCFWINFIISKPDAGQLLYGLAVPGIPDADGAAGYAIGLVGSVIMPHNIFLHTALVHSRKIQSHRRDKVQEANKYFAAEAAVTVGASFLINLAVVSAFANPKIQDQDLDMSNAHKALEGAFGKASVIIWAVGLLAAGQSATMTGTFAGQFVMQGFLNLNLAQWQRVLITRGLTVVPLIFVALLCEENTVESISAFVNVLQAIQLPFALLPLLKFSSSQNAIGAFALSWGTTLAALAFGLAVVGGNFAGLLQDFGWLLEGWWLLLTVPLAVGYVTMLVLIVITPINKNFCIYRIAEEAASLPLQNPADREEEDEGRTTSQGSFSGPTTGRPTAAAEAGALLPEDGTAGEGRPQETK